MTVNGKVSRTVSITVGVQQGSAIGAIFFNETSRARIIEEIRQLQADAAYIDLRINHAKTKLMKIGNYSDFSSILINDNVTNNNNNNNNITLHYS